MASHAVKTQHAAGNDDRKATGEPASGKMEDDPDIKYSLLNIAGLSLWVFGGSRTLRVPARHIQKVASRQTLRGGEEKKDVQRKASIRRPRTAPSIGAAAGLDRTPPVAVIPIDTQRVQPRPPILPPIRPARPDSSVIRDVNAWLEASMNTPSPPLMAGLSYWREATFPGVKDSAAAQHAVPLFIVSGATRPTTTTTTTTSNQQEKMFRRCARKMQVQMPLVLRTKSQRLVGRKNTNRLSASMPLLAVSYEDVREDAPPVPMTRSRSFLRPVTRPSTQHTSARNEGLLNVGQPFRHGTPAGARVGNVESVSERCINTILIRTVRSADSTQPSMAAAGLVREDSTGDLSDAPTYFSGPPPPSYRSRPESVITTSSFGCIDGMSPAQRQISQQRAALQRGMRCKLKRLARTFIV
ncbi:hypothetical protein TW65_71728 [Stemphylium lycopersici]|nr:hypothetical protein TW65_71728 [Stemphylium lycopersici]